MLEILVLPSFRRAYKRVITPGSEREKSFRRKLKLFATDPFSPSLRTHKLKGELREFWSFTVAYDLRVVFYFEDEATAVLFDIGSHDDVY